MHGLVEEDSDAEGGNRTPTELPLPDFESGAATNFTTSAMDFARSKRRRCADPFGRIRASPPFERQEYNLKASKNETDALNGEADSYRLLLRNGPYRHRRRQRTRGLLRGVARARPQQGEH